MDEVIDIIDVDEEPRIRAWRPIFPMFPDLGRWNRILQWLFRIIGLLHDLGFLGNGPWSEPVLLQQQQRHWQRQLALPGLSALADNVTLVPTDNVSSNNISTEFIDGGGPALNTPGSAVDGWRLTSAWTITNFEGFFWIGFFVLWSAFLVSLTLNWKTGRIHGYNKRIRAASNRGRPTLTDLEILYNETMSNKNVNANIHRAARELEVSPRAMRIWMDNWERAVWGPRPDVFEQPWNADRFFIPRVVEFIPQNPVEPPGTAIAAAEEAREGRTVTISPQALGGG